MDITHRDVYEVRRDLLRDASTYAEQEPLAKAHKGAIIGHLNREMNGDLRRTLALAFLFCQDEASNTIEPLSSRELNEGEWHALRVWIDAYQEPASGEWLAASRFPPEAKIVADHAERIYYSSHVVELDPMFDELPEVVRQAMKLGGELTDQFNEPELTRYEIFRRKSTR